MAQIGVEAGEVAKISDSYSTSFPDVTHTRTICNSIAMTGQFGSFPLSNSFYV